MKENIYLKLMKFFKIIIKRWYNDCFIVNFEGGFNVINIYRYNCKKVIFWIVFIKMKIKIKF